MTYEIKTYNALPCSLECFDINGIGAEYEDFGEVCMNGGSCMECNCGSEFEPNYSDDSISNACKKYCITKEEYYEICDELRSSLYVCGCGWCS